MSAAKSILDIFLHFSPPCDACSLFHSSFSFSLSLTLSLSVLPFPCFHFVILFSISPTSLFFSFPSLTGHLDSTQVSDIFFGQMSLRRKKSSLLISFVVDTNCFAPVWTKNYLTRLMKLRGEEEEEEERGRKCERGFGWKNGLLRCWTNITECCSCVVIWRKTYSKNQ